MIPSRWRAMPRRIRRDPDLRRRMVKLVEATGWGFFSVESVLHYLMNVYPVCKVSMAPINRYAIFGIIAHIDQRESTLADRLLEYTAPSPSAIFRSSCSTEWTLNANAALPLNPIRADALHRRGRRNVRTQSDRHPGTCGFSYEVSRSLGACEGAILLIDATQGVPRPDVANVSLAMQRICASSGHQ